MQEKIKELSKDILSMKMYFSTDTPSTTHGYIAIYANDIGLSPIEAFLMVYMAEPTMAIEGLYK